MKRNSVSDLIKGKADFNYVFWWLGVAANVSLAVLWFTWLYLSMRGHLDSVKVLLPSVEIIPISGLFTIMPLFIWTLGYLPLYLLVLAFTDAKSELQEALKKLGIYSSVAGVLTGLFNLYISIYGFV